MLTLCEILSLCSYISSWWMLRDIKANYNKKIQILSVTLISAFILSRYCIMCVYPQ